MCVNGDILDSRIWENYETNMFFFLKYISDVNLRLKLASCMNMWWTTKNMWIKHMNI